MTRDRVWLDLGRAAYDGGACRRCATRLHVSAAVRGGAEQRAVSSDQRMATVEYSCLFSVQLDRNVH
jgi:hypothetical protein